MAYGDPMILDTRYNGDRATQTNFDTLLENGPFEDWSDTAAIADGWTYTNQQGTPTLSRESGARTSGVGSYFQRITHASATVGNLCKVLQIPTLPGNPELGGNGHQGIQFTVTIYARNTGAGTASIQLEIEERDVDDVVGNYSAGSRVNLTGTWTQYTLSRTLTDADTAKIRVEANFDCGAIGQTIVDVDEAELYSTYTFAVNAAMPDEPRIIKPNESFTRTAGNVLLLHGPSADVPIAKYEYSLRFGLIGLAQLKALRSMWLLRTPLRWQPNLPHLPTYVQVYMTGPFGLRMKSPSVNSNNFHGTLQLVER